MKPSTIGITGTTGFVGGGLLSSMNRSHSNSIRSFVRQSSGCPFEYAIGDIGPNTKWYAALEGLQAVVHCAAIAHQIDNGNNQSLYQSVNTEGTLRLARDAVICGVKRFIYISSIKVMGEFTPFNQPFHISQCPAPVDLYGISKWEAEQGLCEIAHKSGMEVVVIRPPLVYGPGVGANFQQLMTWIARGIPLPFSNITNKRSLVAMHNLIDLVETCIYHPAAPGNTFLVSDGNDISTPELVLTLSRYLGKSPKLFPAPLGCLNFAASLLGRRNSMKRLSQSLQVDITLTQQILNWKPPFSVEESIKLTVEDFIKP